ncbi:extracellular ribonuclease LE-like isoform X2 [Alnus glutinosa]|uniref:extracellular ribonuclease LE-like isoform X2 n=1 Tax=Alnus glutinosa TaxID=3517 RepID=UPI002D781356|nr:extracellular ribonuclease LE-like isoform X2 [Alnus glutinosa]
MKGSHWMLITFFTFQLFQAAFCRVHLHNTSAFDQKCQEPALPPGTPLAREYDFIYFVQQISLCYIKSCIKPARPIFSIHGLRPSSYSGTTPSNCGTGSKFDPQKISDLIDRLNVEWPSLVLEDNYELWKYELEKHGICSQALLPQHAFFEAALKLKEKYRLVDMLAEKDIYPFGELYRVDSVTDAIRTATGHNPQIQCNLYKKIPLLSQIFLCFDTNATNIIDCPLKKRCHYDEIMIPFSVWF